MVCVWFVGVGELGGFGLLRLKEWVLCLCATHPTPKPAHKRSSLEDPAVMSAVVAHLERALAPQQ